MIALLTVLYVGLFQAAAWPAIVRVVRRGSSQDLSVWREWLVLSGVGIQFAVMWMTGASWAVLVSPIASSLSLGVLLVVIYVHRGSAHGPA